MGEIEIRNNPKFNAIEENTKAMRAEIKMETTLIKTQNEEMIKASEETIKNQMSAIQDEMREN